MNYQQHRQPSARAFAKKMSEEYMNMSQDLQNLHRYHASTQNMHAGFWNDMSFKATAPPSNPKKTNTKTKSRKRYIVWPFGRK